ncbi:MAG TPA: hypothetical protein DCM40_29020 [Maribacter sp.]|jgi:hypothetical protein|nr:hypothetical protein [Maribacter sp.]|tara:strand:+ start:630 stop:848 length:219 start_codon:yes stop_codon:yes gene_type:complete
MTLKDYMLEKKIKSYGRLAQLLGIKHSKIVQRWCLPFDHKERVIPSPVYMDRIIKATQGAVMPNDFYIQKEE